MDFSSEHYLPNSEERIEHLREIVAGRPAAILVSGPSLKELEARIGELRQADICYFGLNSFVPETHILPQIDQHLSIFMCSALRDNPILIKDITSFLNRDEDNMFVSSFWRNTFDGVGDDFDLNQFLSIYDKKLIFFYLSYSRTVPNRNYPLHLISGTSLQILIQLAIISKASKIVLFGADGGYEDSAEKHYYRQGEYKHSPRENLIRDAKMAFNPIVPISIRNTYDTYKISPIDILNCSENSLYTSFPRVSYDDAFEYLLTNKKFNRKSDLRVPKVSIISPVVNTRGFLKETIDSISNQSYSNHEHIIVYDEADDETRNMMQQFPHVRWVSEKEYNHLQAFRKGVSLARGEYICYCPVADSYADPDWLNTCVGIMENRPDISLIWGLCQNMSENGALGRIANAQFLDNPPPQEKEFIYYWLKKKILFPEGNICVRKRVLEECFPSNDGMDEREAWLSFNYNFNTFGYLPCFVSVVANYHRTYRGKKELRKLTDGYNVPPFYFVFLTANSDAQEQEAIADEGWHMSLNKYCDNIQQYKKLLMRGRIVHHYRDGKGEVLPDYINRSSFLSHGIQRYAKNKLPDRWVLFYKKMQDSWRIYRWSMFRIAVSRRLHRLKTSAWNRGIQSMKKQK